MLRLAFAVHRICVSLMIPAQKSASDLDEWSEFRCKLPTTYNSGSQTTSASHLKEVQLSGHHECFCHRQAASATACVSLRGCENSDMFGMKFDDQVLYSCSFRLTNEVQGSWCKLTLQPKHMVPCWQVWQRLQK